MPNRQVSSSYVVKKGDTVWALTTRALTDKLGRKPTNAEINRVMRSGTKTVSGNIDKIKPGERVTINLRSVGDTSSVGAGRTPGRPPATTPPRKRTLPSTNESVRKRTLPASPGVAKKTPVKKTGVRHTDRRNTLLGRNGKKAATKRTAPSRTTGRTGRGMGQY